MALNIKNEEVHRLVEELAHITGESQTAAVRHAVEEKLDRVKRDADKEMRLKRLMEIAKSCAEGLGPEPLDIDALLYDERGLPK